MGRLRRSGYTGIQIAVGIVIILALVALVFLAAREMQIPIPGFVISALWIVGVAVVIICAMLFIYKFWSRLGGPPGPQ